MMRRGPDNSSVSFGISDAFSWKTNTLSRAQHWADVKSLNTPLNNISVMRSSSALQISHATRPFISMTSDAVAYPIRRRTLFRHFSSSICSSDLFFFS
ncbi:hypothetical protein NP493_315g00027 [Ridgeia piscesae]|uniref:Uncharacterized protein n=1 Tax=Ridgeia piscesae TaxID=27915 RepID=A0AAD9L6F6_RIDPI|nr:hypothetical protein NP493_315g00027 [Ridgeia piscesae]